MNEFLWFSDVPILSLDDLVKIGEIELGRGDIISKIDIRENIGGYPIYSSSSKNNGKMGEYGKFMFDEEMITWSVDGGGNFFLRPKHRFSVTNVSGYMKVNTSKFNYKFLHASLDLQHQYLNFDYQTKAHPSVIRKLYKIPILPLSEQKKIATILTSVDEVIENTQKQIDKLQDLKKATMNELLIQGIGYTQFKDSDLGRIPKGWEKIKLKDISVIRARGITYNSANYTDRENGLPFLTLKSVSKGGGYSLGSLKFYKGEFKPYHVLKNGDILFANTDLTRDGDVIGSPLYFDSSKFSGRTLYSHHLSKLSVDKMKANGKFLYYLLMSHQIKRFMINSSAGSTVLNLDVSWVKELQLTVPPLPEQKKIVSILISIDEKIENTQKKFEKIQSLKKSLMQDLLTGRVRVRTE